MNTLRIKLKQHTPMIHFQHGQQEATVRASEIKPKLDRFVLTRLGNGDYQSGVALARERGWLVGRGDHPALNYKIRIEARKVSFLSINERKKYEKKHEGKPFLEDKGTKYLARRRKTDNKLIYDLSPYPLFFANMDADYTDSGEYRKFSFTSDPLNLVLVVLKDDLYTFLSNPDLLNDFFFQTNFGMRQSKGFGSFGIDPADPNYRARRSRYWFEIDSGRWDDIEYINEEFKRVFEYIELFYKTLRGGVNLINGKRETLFYFKSLLYLFANDRLNAKWDKRKIKEEFYGIDVLEKDHTYDVRDMLGFSTNEQWLSYHDSIEKKSSVWDDSAHCFREPRGTEKPSAERMPSPILIKPVYDEGRTKYFINILFQDDKVNMNGFKGVQQISIRSKNHNKVFGIDIPQEFSTESFFHFIFEELHFDISTHVDECYHGHKYFHILEDIFSQINNNL